VLDAVREAHDWAWFDEHKAARGSVVLDSRPSQPAVADAPDEVSWEQRAPAQPPEPLHGQQCCR
jgi:hypothetical protein